MARFIAFDAAKRRTGWAYWHPGRGNEKVWMTGVVAPADTAKLMAVVRLALDDGIDDAVIENCFLGRNFQTSKTLQAAQTRIAVACEAYGLEVTLVYPQTWQAAFGITGLSPDRKAGAKRVARLLGAHDGVTEDEADAICLCEYMEKTGRQVELALAGPRGGTYNPRNKTKPKGQTNAKRKITADE